MTKAEVPGRIAGRPEFSDDAGINSDFHAVTMQRFSTNAVPQGARLGYWHQIHRNQSEVLRFTRASNADFAGECVTGTLGPLTVRRTSSTPIRIELTAEAIKSASVRRYFLLLPTTGSLQVSYNDRDCTLAPGDFVLLDTWTPSVVEFDTLNESITVGVSPSTLAAHLPEAEYAAGIPIRGGFGTGLLASNMLQTLAVAVEQGLDAAAELRLADCLLAIVATSYRSTSMLDRCTQGRAALNRLRAKRIIEEHLRDPGLSPQFVARALGISTRYLRMLFENQGEPVSRYILRRRLEKCAEHLRYGGTSSATLTTIAFMYGFSSMAHFSRVFREHFAMTAGRYRALHVRPPAAVDIEPLTARTQPLDPAAA